MKFRIELTNNCGYHWWKTDRVFFKGICQKSDEVLNEDDALALFSQVKNADEFVEAVRTLDGFFSVVVICNDEIYATVDQLRSFPLFYGKVLDEWVVTDALPLGEQLQEKGCAIDQKAMKQFMASLMVIGHRTLLREYSQIQAGEYLVISNGCHTGFWTEYRYSNSLMDNMDDALEFLEKENEKTYTSLIRMLNGRQAVVPLSGGHDSRQILYYLKKMGYKNVITYSYGKKHNQESKYAEEVAKVLDVPFYFVEYSNKLMKQWASCDMAAYMNFSGNAVSVPCVQEPAAISYLQKKGIIDNDAVILPGFSGDFLAGSHLCREVLGEENIGRERFTQLVLKSHFRDGGKCTSRFSDNSIEQIKSINYFTKNGSRFSNAENFEKFDYMERQAKFIQNAVRTYEFYGYQWLTPFFFRNQIIAWSKLSPLLRFERTAFFAFENKHYPENLKEIGFAAQVTKARVWRKVYQVAFDPYSLHQLMPIFSKLTYYRALLESKIYNINWLVKNEYLKSSGVGK